MINSEVVPRGKGEKHPGEGDEIEPETICLQGIGVLFRRKAGGRRCAYWRM